MAALDGEITIRFERRPCVVDGRKAMFHRWADSSIYVKHSPTWKFELERRAIITGEPVEEKDVEYLSQTMGIVEFEDGEVKEVYPQQIRFTDSTERTEHG